MPHRGYLLRESKVFCLKPWVNMTLPPDGRVRPCCDGASDLPIGSVRKNSLAEIWNSERMRDLRRNMLAGRPSELCSRCYELEAAGCLSSRQWVNQALASHFSRVEKTTPEGMLSGPEPVTLDLMLSNSCNFRCRSCNPSLSSSWHGEHGLMHGNGGGPALLTAADDVPELLRQVEAMSRGLEQIYFAGGEPLLQETHYLLLERMIERGRTDIALHYNTNLSTLTFNGMDVLKLWNRFRSVKIGASLDASGRRGEYIRKGQDWARTVSHRERILRECPRLLFHVAPTLSVLNAFALPDFHREWLESGYLPPGGFPIGYVLNPEILRIQILPSAWKRRVAAKYDAHIGYLRRCYGRQAESDIHQFRAAVQFMMARDRSSLLPEFAVWTRRLDAIRKESFEEIFPELADLLTCRQEEAPAPEESSSAYTSSALLEVSQLLARGEKAEAAGCCEKIVPERGGEAPVQDGRFEEEAGWIYLEMMRLEEAKSRFQKALASGERLEAAMGLSLVQRLTGEREEALAGYRALMAGNNREAAVKMRVEFEMGQLWLETGNLQEASECFAGVLAGNAKIPWKKMQARLGLAAVDLRRELWQEALRRSEEILQESQPFPELRLESHYLRGCACLGLGRLEEAEEDFRSALDLLSRELWFGRHAALGLAEIDRRRNRPEAALLRYDAFLRRHAGAPETADALCGMGRILLAQGRLEEAAGRFRGVLAEVRRPRLIGEARLGLAEILRRQGRKEESLAECRAALSSAEGLPELELRAHCEMGRLHLEAGEWEAAEENYRRVLAAAPRPAWLREEAERELAKLRRRREPEEAGLA